MLKWNFEHFSIVYAHTHTHTHFCLTALCPGLPRWASTRKVKPIWILLKQETMSGSGISWAICKSAPRSRPITTPAPTTQFFTGWMPFLPPNQQRQSTEAPYSVCSVLNIEYCNLCNSYLVVDHTFFMNITLIKSAHMSRMIYSFVQLEVKYSSFAAKCICPSSSLSIGLVAGIYDR